MSRFNKKTEVAAAKETEAAQAKARLARRDRKQERWLAVGVIAAILLIIGGMALLATMSVTWQKEALAANLRTMEQQVGIVNGQEYSLVIADNVSVANELRGTVFLFMGSISAQPQEELRLGYTAPNGDSYIISVPIEKIVFHQKEGPGHGAVFQFNDWDPQLNLQQNIDGFSYGYPYFERITVILTPEEFTQLIG